MCFDPPRNSLRIEPHRRGQHPQCGADLSPSPGISRGGWIGCALLTHPLSAALALLRPSSFSDELLLRPLPMMLSTCLSRSRSPLWLILYAALPSPRWRIAHGLWSPFRARFAGAASTRLYASSPSPRPNSSTLCRPDTLADASSSTSSPHKVPSSPRSSASPPGPLSLVGGPHGPAADPDPAAGSPGPPLSMGHSRFAAGGRTRRLFACPCQVPPVSAGAGAVRHRP